MAAQTCLDTQISCIQRDASSALTIHRSRPILLFLITIRRPILPRLPRLLQLPIIQPRLPISDLPRLLLGPLVVSISIRQGRIVDIIPIPHTLLRLIPLLLLLPPPALGLGSTVLEIILVLVAHPILEITLLHTRLLLSRRLALLLRRTRRYSRRSHRAGGELVQRRGGGRRRLCLHLLRHLRALDGLEFQGCLWFNK